MMCHACIAPSYNVRWNEDRYHRYSTFWFIDTLLDSGSSVAMADHRTSWPRLANDGTSTGLVSVKNVKINISIDPDKQMISCVKWAETSKLLVDGIQMNSSSHSPDFLPPVPPLQAWNGLNQMAYPGISPNGRHWADPVVTDLVRTWTYGSFTACKQSMNMCDYFWITVVVHRWLQKS